MIRKFDENDVDRCAEVVADAFKNDPLYVHALRSEDEKHHFSRFLVRKSLTLGEVGIVAQKDGTIMGVASMETDSGNAFQRSMSLIKWSFLKEAMLLKKMIRSEGFKFFNDYMRFTTSVRPKGFHHYLVFVGVSPHSQGQGVGGEMLRYLHGIVDADERSLGIGLDTENEANVGYYKRFGYELVASKEIDGVIIYVMFRKRKA